MCRLEPESKRHVWWCTWTLNVTQVVGIKWSDVISRQRVNGKTALLTSLTAQSGIGFASDTNSFLSPMRLGPNPLHPSSSSRRPFSPFWAWCRCAAGTFFDALRWRRFSRNKVKQGQRLVSTVRRGQLCVVAARVLVWLWYKKKRCRIDQNKLASRKLPHQNKIRPAGLWWRIKVLVCAIWNTHVFKKTYNKH